MPPRMHDLSVKANSLKSASASRRPGGRVGILKNMSLGGRVVSSFKAVELPSTMLGIVYHHCAAASCFRARHQDLYLPLSLLANSPARQ